MCAWMCVCWFICVNTVHIAQILWLNLYKNANVNQQVCLYERECAIVRVCVSTHIYGYVYRHIYTRTHIYGYIYRHIYTRINVYMYINMSICIHTHVYIYIDVHINIHTLAYRYIFRHRRFTFCVNFHIDGCVWFMCILLTLIFHWG